MRSGGIELLNIDCMEYMSTVPDKFFDLAIVDPPYKDETNGLSAGYNRSHFEYKHFNAPDKKYISELFRVSKNQIMWGFNYYLELLPNTDAIIFWNKHQNGHFSEGEAAWCSLGKTRYFDRAYQKDIFHKIHPTQKPIQLYRWILKHYADTGWKILDTHLGSGSIAIACFQEGFELTATEIDTGYYEAAIRRFQFETTQSQLVFR